MALDVIDISAEGLVAYVVAESRTGRPPSGRAGEAPNWPPFNGM
jgi:hypothetical protein